jgi:hypothetical protein
MGNRKSMGYRWGYFMEYGLSIWDTVYRYGHPPYRYGHPGYRYGIWAYDMGDESIDMIILHIDMGYVVTLGRTLAAGHRRAP